MTQKRRVTRSAGPWRYYDVTSLCQTTYSYGISLGRERLMYTFRNQRGLRSYSLPTGELAFDQRALAGLRLSRLLRSLGRRCLHGSNRLVLFSQHIRRILKIEKLHRLSRDQLHGHARQAPTFRLPAKRPHNLVGLLAIVELFGPDAADMRAIRITLHNLGGPHLIGRVRRALHIDRQRMAGEFLAGLRGQQRFGSG